MTTIAATIASSPSALAPRVALRGHGLVISSALVSLLICFWFVTWGDGRLLESERFGGFYDAQARAILHGRLDVPPEAIDFEAFVRDGKSYGYFGIAPALLRLPLVILFPAMDGKWSRAMMLLACAINLWCAQRLLRRIACSEAGAAPLQPGWIALFVLCAGVGSTSVFIVSRSYTYHEAIMWGATFALLFADRLLSYLEHASLAALAAAGAFAFLSFHSRATVGAGVLLSFSVVALALGHRVIRSRTTPAPDAQRDRLVALPPVERPMAHMLLAGAILVLIVGVYFGVNYAKFRTFDGVPVRLYALYQKDPARMQVTGGRQFHLENVPTGIASYFGLSAVRVGAEFPWLFMAKAPAMIGSPALDVVEPYSSIPLCMPALFLLALLGIRPLLAAPHRTLAHYRLLAVALLMGASIVLLTVGITQRYLHDFYPFLLIAGAVGLTRLAAKPPITRLALLAVLTLASIYINCAFALEFQREIVWGVPWSKRQQLLHVRQSIDRFLNRAPLAAAGE